MSTKAFIQNLIDTNLADDSDILPEEHREVEDALLDEMFPDSIWLRFNGSSQTSGMPNIQVPSDLDDNWKVDFSIYFEKIGNRVFYSGFISNAETSRALGNNVAGITLATFPTTLYKPSDNDRFSSSTLNKIFQSPVVLPNACITFSFNGGIILYGSIPQGVIDLYIEGSYKVAN